VLVFGLALAGYAPAAATKEVAPFEYRFRVTSVTLTSTFTKDGATATTELQLGSVPKAKSMTWWGTKGLGRGIPWNGVGAVNIRMAGTVTYSGLENPACNSTVTLDTSRWRPISASVALAQSWTPARAKLSAGAGRFPVATIYPRQGGACENGVRGRHGAVRVRPPGGLLGREQQP
jgi:hypothetical protein